LFIIIYKVQTVLHFSLTDYHNLVQELLTCQCIIKWDLFGAHAGNCSGWTPFLTTTDYG